MEQIRIRAEQKYQKRLIVLKRITNKQKIKKQSKKKKKTGKCTKNIEERKYEIWE